MGLPLAAAAAPTPPGPASDTITVRAVVPLMESFVAAVRASSELTSERRVLRPGQGGVVSVFLSNGVEPLRGHRVRLAVVDAAGETLWEDAGKTDREGRFSGTLESGEDWPKRVRLQAEYLQYPERPILLPDQVTLAVPQPDGETPNRDRLDGLLCGEADRGMMTENDPFSSADAWCGAGVGFPDLEWHARDGP